MRIVSLGPLEGGISRLRSKGGANPKWLWDLENGYVAQDGSVQSRPGTTDEIVLPTGTKGLTSANGKLVVFSNTHQTITDPRVVCEIITHPTDPTLALLEIHFAGPFLGGDSQSYLYVVAEFNDLSVWHYWLRHADAWAASGIHQLGDLVEPTVANGYVYRATRLNPAGTAWAPNVAHTMGDVVEPTTFNGYKFTVTDTLGSNPRSGTVEPTWPASDGATVSEDTDLTAGTTPTTGTTTPPTTTVPTDVSDRYGNLRDSFGGISR